MRRRSRAGGKPIKTRRRKAATPSRFNAPKVSGRRKPSSTNDKTTIALLKRERDEALEQQRATSEVLSAISNSPTDTASTLSAIAKSVARLLEVTDAEIMSVEGDVLRSVAKHGSASQWPMGTTRLMSRDWVTGRAVIDRAIVHVADLQASERDFPQGAAYARQFGHRTILAVPLLREGSAIGAFLIRRMAVKPFSDKQIELVQNFAAQAVIAIENTRLLNELRQRTDDLSEALERQTATADVLKVISSSPGELEPVFQAMLENATHLCGAKFGNLYQFVDGAFQIVASHSASASLASDRLREPPIRPASGTGLGRVLTTKAVAQIADVLNDPAYPADHPLRTAAERGGVRTLLAVPMLKDNNLVGAITILRQEVLPFTDKQIALVENFAAQAVIAIENTRLLNELRQRTDDLSESLEQQTATSEVLKVISSSPGELAPVFDVMLENATHLCGAQFGTLTLCDGEEFRNVARYNIPSAFAESLNTKRFRPHPNSALGEVARTKRTAHIEDIHQLQSYRERDPVVVNFADLTGARTIATVPMLKDDELVGVISIFRQAVHPFSDKQITLLANFAAQAVIAIENTRLLTELRQRTTDLTESLEQQTATSEVLSVISSSPGELEPVFRAMLENATRLCEANFGGLFLTEGPGFRSVAQQGPLLGWWERDPFFDVRRHPGLPLSRVAGTKAVVHVTNLAMEAASHAGDARFVALVETAGARTVQRRYGLNQPTTGRFLSTGRKFWLRTRIREIYAGPSRPPWASDDSWSHSDGTTSCTYP
jgi:GAF domain-containing protein